MRTVEWGGRGEGGGQGRRFSRGALLCAGPGFATSTPRAAAEGGPIRGCSLRITWWVVALERRHACPRHRHILSTL